MEIYMDILFAENFIINYMILFLSSIVLKVKASHFRLIAGAFIGAVYVIVMVMCPNFKLFFTIISKFLLSLMMVAVTFYPKTLKILIKTLIVFYGVTFLYAGACYAFMNILDGGGLVKNGIFFVMSGTTIETILISAGIVMIIIKTIADIVRNNISRKRLVIPLKITYSTHVKEIYALIDTGNALYEPITKKPVVIVEYHTIKDILSPLLQRIFMCEPGHEVESLIHLKEWQDIRQTDEEAISEYKRICMIPFSSIGKENGMLIGIKPDFIEVGGEDRIKAYQNVIIGIYTRKLSPDNEYQAILNPELAG